MSDRLGFTDEEIANSLKQSVQLIRARKLDHINRLSEDTYKCKFDHVNILLELRLNGVTNDNICYWINAISELQKAIKNIRTV